MPATMTIKATDFIPDFVKLSKSGKKSVLANTFAAIHFLSIEYAKTWRAAAGGTRTLPGLPFFVHGTGYPKSIKSRQVSNSVWEIYTDYTTKTGLSVTELLEKGHGLIDLKPGLLKGPKSRVGKNGRYNIVPYTHGGSESDEFRSNPMPNVVEASLNSLVKKADAARKAGDTSVKPGVTTTDKKTGITTWGQSLKKGSGVDLGERQTKIIQKKNKPLGSYQWKAGKYEGMYKLQQSTSRQQRGGAITFRVVSANSPKMSWMVPEQEPWPIRKAVVDFMTPFAEAILAEAMEADLR